MLVRDDALMVSDTFQVLRLRREAAFAQDDIGGQARSPRNDADAMGEWHALGLVCDNAVVQCARAAGTCSMCPCGRHLFNVPVRQAPHGY